MWKYAISPDLNPGRATSQSLGLVLNVRNFVGDHQAAMIYAFRCAKRSPGSDQLSSAESECTRFVGIIQSGGTEPLGVSQFEPQRIYNLSRSCALIIFVDAHQTLSLRYPCLGVESRSRVASESNRV